MHHKCSIQQSGMQILLQADKLVLELLEFAQSSTCIPSHLITFEKNSIRVYPGFKKVMRGRGTTASIFLFVFLLLFRALWLLFLIVSVKSCFVLPSVPSHA